MNRWLVVLLAVIAPFFGCDRERERREPKRDPQRERRVIEPPVGNVRPLPPHAIRADGVGPYRIGEKLSEILAQLPSGPRIAVFEIPELLHRSVIRAEDDMLLVGGEPGSTTTFVAVVGPDVARTEFGIHVGSTKAEVLNAFGPSAGALDSAHDPRVIVPSTMRNARILLDQDRVAAIVVTADSGTPARAPPREGVTDPCPRPKPSERGFGACLFGPGELVEVATNEVTVRAVETGRAMVAFRVPSPIVFAAPLRTADGRDELVVITRADEAQQRRWILNAYRFDTGKIVRTIEPAVLYRVSSSNTRWIGAELDEIELYLEFANRADGIDVGGLLTTRSEKGLYRDVVVISPISVPRRVGKSLPAEGSVPPAGPDAGGPDASLVREGSAAGVIRANP